ncbi:major facilitator superfamily domain-containing protein [Scheffersomyces xylosifermentans]|uniref:major facilitator superfamily domain-containing protein n=1 Tax=Scheffersomyces xylosifermentans TaxID=1304137 RepID=UPI00315D89DE
MIRRDNLKHSDVDIASVKKGANDNSSQEQEPRMDGGYGWVIVFSAFLISTSTWGLNSSFGIYFSYYLNNNTFEGATRVDYAAIGGISFGLGLVFAPIINYIQGWIGTRPLIVLGNSIQFASIIMASFSVNLWELYLTQGVLQSLGLAMMSLPALTLVSQWFVKRRVLANALSVSGSGVGGVIFNVGMQRIIETQGYQSALRAQAIISFGLGIIAVLLIKTRSKHHKVEFTFYDLDCLKCVGFWLLTFYLITCILGYVVVLYSLATYTVSLGFTNHQGSVVSSMVQVAFCFARPMAGFISDYYGPLTVTTISYYLAGIFALGLWIPVRTYAGAIMLAFIEGNFIGAIFPTVAAITVRLVGISKLNVSFSMSWMFFGAAGVVSELIGVALTSGTDLDNPKSFRNTAIFAGLCFLVCATFSLALRGYIIARDVLYDAIPEEDISKPSLLQVRVPPHSVFLHCLHWPQKRA